MRRILNIFSFALTMLLAGNTTGQVEEVHYALSYNNSTSLYDCFLIIEKGETNTDFHRIQFNSQVSVVVPHGTQLQVVDSYMPLVGKENGISRKSIEWVVTDHIVNELDNGDSDYYSISPNITQTAFYNHIKEGDRIKIFSLGIKENNKTKIRLYQNGVDKDMIDTDLSNGFSLGGANQLIKNIAINEENELQSDVNKEND